MKKFLYFLIFANICFSEPQIPIEYGGITIFCDDGCGDLSDPDQEEIESIFADCVKTVFRRCSVFDEGLNFHWADPWGNPGEDDPCYFPWDWKASNGFWPNKEDPFITKTLALGRYSQFQEIANAMREDLHFYYIDWPQFAIQKCNSLLEDLRMIDQNKYRNAIIYDRGRLSLSEYNWWEYGDDGKVSQGIRRKNGRIDFIIQSFEKEILSLEEFESKYSEYSPIVEKALAEIETLYKRMFSFCLKNHQLEGAAFKAAVNNLIMGEYQKGISQIDFLINFVEKRNLGKELLSKLHFLRGELQTEFGLYSDAVIALTTAIQKDPSQKEVYLQRATSYFELGDFDKAVEDYLTYDLHKIDPKYKPIWEEIPLLGIGISTGIAKGAFTEAIDFFPETLSTAKGLGLGLWACIKDPVGASMAFANAAKECVQYIRNHSSFQFAQDMVPELKELVQRYDEFSEFQRGELIGQVIGKYGVDILMCKFSAKAIKAYKDLKKANQLMTLELLASQKYQQEILEASKKFWLKRQEFLKNTNLLVDWNQQGKHIISHKNYSIGKSIWDLPQEKTQELINKCAGTGIKMRGDILGAPGYQEIINFEVQVGYVTLETTGEKLPTTWGKIHYSKKGVHVVPFLPGE